MPTRLIDLVPVDGDRVPRIQLETNLRSQKIDYVALSYCWGTGMPEHVKTTTQNIEDRSRKGFSAENCPQTIKDAFNFTRALGLRYIWIDVLCILQDSERDWMTQSTKMGLVYSSAYCTLAASASTDTNSGLPFYDFTNTLDSDSFILAFGFNNEGKQERVCISVRSWNRTGDSQIAYDPLQKRGWTLQERHLSHRVVYFSHENLFWECKQARSSTSLPWCAWSPLTSQNRRLFDGDKETLREHLDGGGWQCLIWDYSKRALTYERDKFYAIAGLVEAVDNVLACDDQYLAGLWRSTLPVSLCWKSSLYTSSDGQLTARLRAPSWSWASLSGPIYIGAEPLGLRRVYTTVVGAQTTASHDTDLGLKYEGWVRLKGPLKRVFLCASPLGQHFLDANPDLDYNSRLFEREGDKECIGAAILDVSPGHDIRYEEVFCLAVASDNRRFRVDDLPSGMFSEGDAEDERSLPDILVSLVLTPTRRAGEYRRVGLSEYMFESKFEGCEESVVTVI